MDFHVGRFVFIEQLPQQPHLAAIERGHFKPFDAPALGDVPGVVPALLQGPGVLEAVGANQRRQPGFFAQTAQTA
ncbi:hypothetical protein D3C81_1986010 [compost metagenome]